MLKVTQPCSFLENNNLKNIVTEVTRPDSGTIIDHVYVDLEIDTETKVTQNLISDHCSVIFEYKTQISLRNLPGKIDIFNYIHFFYN